jgi:sugar/nucleoside kinase (ribokinase family)
MTGSPYRIVLMGRAALDLHTRFETRVLLRDQGLMLRHPAGCEAFIRTGQTPVQGSKIEAVTPLDELVGTVLVQEPCLGGGAVNASGYAARMSRDHGGRAVRICLVVENKTSGALATLANRDGFDVSFGNLSDIPVNLIVSDGTNRTILKSPRFPPEDARTLGQFLTLQPLVRDANVVAFISPSSPIMVAALAAFSNGALRIAQPTGAMDLASTLLMVQSVDDLVLSYDELMRLSIQSGCWLDNPGSEDSPQALNTVTRALRCLKELRLAGSKSAAVTRGRLGCIVADWTSDRIESIGMTLGENVATRSGAGDTFLGAWAFYRAQGYGPVDAAIRATRRVVEWHGLIPEQYQIRLTTL